MDSGLTSMRVTMRSTIAGSVGSMQKSRGEKAPTFTSPSIPPRDSRLRGCRSACLWTTSKSLMQRQYGVAPAVLHELRVEPWGRSARYEDFDGNVIEPTQHTKLSANE